MPSLFIVESPNKIKTISKFVGSDFILKASVGHCYQIEPKDDAIDIDNNYTPRYVPISNKKKVIQEIKKIAKTCDVCYIATDPDREGEAIGWHIANFVIKNKCEIKRISFQEITKSAVQFALKNPYELDSNLFNAQQARVVIDRLVGYKVSPVLWKKVCKGTSAGRVQSIGLRFIVDRQTEIDAFVPEEYWTIRGKFQNSTKNDIFASYKSSEKLTNEDQVKCVIVSIKKSKKWSVKDVSKARKNRSPYPVFNTSSLQQFCSSTFGWDGKKTMRVAQSLYEGASINGNDRTGLITYHRTDSLNISNEAIEQVRNYISKTAGKKYVPNKPRIYKSKKSAQEAHEGIRPTHLEYSLLDIKQSVENDEYKLYEAIYYRFISSQTIDASFDTTKIKIISDNEEHIFTISGQILAFDGFLKFWKYSSIKDECLPELSEGDILKLKSVDTEQHFTKPPAAYNTASLVKTLEEEGIGRPSTYATIISTLLKRAYIEKNGKAFKPTDLGKSICAYLVSSFPELMNTNYTARIENELDDIAQNGKVWYNVVDAFFSELSKRLDKSKDSISMKSKETDILCPECQSYNLVKKRSKYGWFYGCAGFSIKGKNKCRATFQIGENDEPVKKVKKEIKYIENAVCNKCGSPIVIRKANASGKEFGGCSSFPKCKGIFNLDGTPVINSKFKRRRSS